MTQRALALLVTALLATVLPEASARSADPEIVDPEGDARITSSSKVVNTAINGCRAAQPVTSFACLEARRYAQPGHAEPIGGLPAPPALDILSVSFDETPTEVLVRVELAGLSEDFEGFVGEDATGAPRTGTLHVDWEHGPDAACWEMAVFVVDPRTLESISFLERAVDDCPAEEGDPWMGSCNAWSWCEMRLEHELEFGTPGYVTMRVPRAALRDGASGSTLASPRAETRVIEGDALSPWWSAQAASGERVDGTLLTQTRYTVDITREGRDLTLALAESSPPPATEGEPHVQMPENAGADPRKDILALDVRETTETITIDLTLAEVAEAPEDVWYWLAMDFPTGHVSQVFVDSTPEGERFSAARISVGESALLFGGYEVLLPSTLDVTVGTPGTVSVTIDRSDLPPIRAGETSKLLVASVVDDAYHVHHHEHLGEGGAGFGATGVGGEWQGDYTWGTPLYVFELDTPDSAYEGIFRLHDPPGDARLSQLASATGDSASKLDITFVELRAISDTVTDFTLGIRDLSRATVPAGYGAMFYAFGVRAGDASTMVGYYKSADDPAGDFLCAPDITVLSETQRDPAEAVWTTITGVITAPHTDDDAGGGGGPGAITIHVPHECFGSLFEVGEEVVFDKLAASTFLVRNGVAGATDGNVEPVDQAEVDGVVSLAVPREEVTPAAWYAAPFGVSNFWDILGIGVALVVGGTGAAMKLHRRKLDKAALADAKAREDREVYRAALVRAVASRADVSEDEVLQALRRRLGISDREHALLELEARAAAGVSISGLAAGARFLGKYRVERQLGEGGFARTFLARDEKLARRVVLKIARWSSSAETRRALHEARALAQLDHPNIVKIHDVDEVADQVVLVLEHVPGGSLADHPGARSPAEATRIADGVLAALEAAHSEGIVHRDVKPANILLAKDGAPKLADFGIARIEAAAGATAGASVAGVGAGTVRYMSPEQARGQPADARSDVYAAGVVFYEMLAGRPYLDLQGLTDFEIRAAIGQETPALPLPGVDPRLNALLARALEKDATKRPQTAAQMRAMLR